MNFGIIFIGVVAAGIFLYLMILQERWEEAHSVSLIQQWTTQNGYQLISAYRNFMPSLTPFWAADRKSHTFYRITVQDTNGNTMSGYALCGGFYGLWSNRIEVKWDR